MRKILLYAVVLAVLAYTTAALGIGPVLVYKVFQPGQEQHVTLTVFNDGSKDLSIDVSARGELAPYIKLENSSYRFSSETYPLHYTLTMPDDLAPGAHYADIVVTESPTTSQATVQALVSGVSKLRVQVPYNEKYAEAKLDIDASESKAAFSVYVYNYCSQRLNVSSHIRIYNQDGSNVKNIDLPAKSIDPMSEESMSAEAMLQPGVYNATLQVSYGGKSIVVNKGFIVGEKLVEITGVSVDGFEPGEIASIRLHLKSHWPSMIKGAKGEVTIIKDNRLIDTIRTETFDIQGEKELSAYWNTQDQEPGTYSAEASIMYDGKVSTKDFNITIPGPAAQAKRPALIIPVVIIVLVVVIAVLYYVWRMRRKPGRRRARKG